MDWAEKITRGFLVAIPAYQLYQSTQAAYDFNKNIPVSVKGGTISDRTGFASAELQSQFNNDPHLPYIQKGMEVAEKKLSEITQVPIGFLLRHDIASIQNNMHGAVTPFKDSNGDKAVLFASNIQTLKFIGAGLPAYEAILYHEGGHIVLKQAEQRIRMNHKIDSVSFLASVALYFASPYLPAETAKDTRNNNIMITAVQLGLQFAWKQYYSRQREWQADEYAIKHCKNPEALEATAHCFQASYEHEKAHQGSFLGPFFEPISFIVDNTIESHPSDKERAELFFKAAQKLREESKQKSSLWS
jgi:hypothetical protein